MRLRILLAACLAAASIPLVAAEQPTTLTNLTTPSWALQVSGISYHFSPPSGKYALKKWNEQNWGLGLEYRKNTRPGYWLKATGGFMLDSTDTWSTYVGAALQKRLVDGEVSVDAGAAGFIFYRGLENGRKRLLPAVLPVVSIEHRATGLGLNLLAVPEFKAQGMHSPTVVFAQLTYRF